MFDGILLCKGVAIQGQNGSGGPAVDYLEGLLLMFVPSNNDDGMTVQVVHGGSHNVKTGCRDQGGFVHHHHVELV